MLARTGLPGLREPKQGIRRMPRTAHLDRRIDENAASTRTVGAAFSFYNIVIL